MSEFRAAKHNFSPVIEKDSRMLFLGSVPSVASEKAGFFYMHKTNRFWRILGEIFGENFYDASIEQKFRFSKSTASRFTTPSKAVKFPAARTAP